MPLKARYPARREAEAMRPEAERLVEQLWRQKNDLAVVVETLRADRALSDPLRQAAPFGLPNSDREFRPTWVSQLTSVDIPLAKQTVFAIDAFPAYWRKGEESMDNPKVDSTESVKIVKTLR